MKRFIGFIVLFLVLMTTAVTIQAAPAATLTVTNTNDSGAGSLRAQIAAANPGDTIQFNAALSGQTITLTSGEIVFSKNLTIDGSTLANSLTISGNENSRIFYITAGTVNITGLRFIDGASNDGDPGVWDGDGGAVYIRDNATVTIDSSEFVNNQSQSNGGALYIWESTVTLANNTFTNNSTLYAGGAIRTVSAQSVLVTDNTFVDNTASEGGAIWASGGAEVLTNNTFYNNNGSYTVFLYNTLNLNNNTFLGNDGVFVRNGAAVLHMRNNIIGSCLVVGGGTIATNVNNWIVNGSCSPAYSGNPYLMPLADNGGATQTAALMPFSSAINAGASSCPATDQRGQARGATCDLGAYETQSSDYQTNQCYSGLVQGETYAFGATGILITVDTVGSLTELCAQLTQSNHPNATAGIQTGRYWTVTPTAGVSNWSVTMSAPATMTLDGDDKLCRYTGTGAVWDCAMTSIDNTNNRITRSGITQLSPWAVGDGVGPTAVSLQSLSAQSPIALPVLVLLLLVMMGITAVFFRRAAR